MRRHTCADDAVRRAGPPWQRLAGAVAATVLAACSTPPPPLAEPVDWPDRYGRPTPPHACPRTSQGGPAAGWWQGFGSTELDGLVASALQQAPGVQVQAEQVQAARAQWRAARAALLPRLDLGVSVGRQRRLSGGGDSGTTVDVGGSEDDGDAGGSTGDSARGLRGQASLSLDWQPDLWGEGRLGAAGAQAQLERQQALADRLSRQAAAGVVRAWLTWHGALTRLELLERSLQAQERTLQIVQSRRRAGLAGGLDEQRALADLATAQAQREPLRRSAAQSRHALALLTGRWPQDPAVAPQPAARGLPEWRGPAWSSPPLERLRCRPDLAEAEALLRAAAAEVGIAEARLRPRLSLPGSLTLSAAGLGDGGRSTLLAALSAVLDLPLFDGGERAALREAAQARWRAAAFARRDRALQAAAEVEDALAVLSEMEASLAARRRAAQAGQQAFEQARVLYREGLVAFIDVLDTQRSLLAQRDAEAQAEVARLLALAGVHEALGLW